MTSWASRRASIADKLRVALANGLRRVVYALAPPAVLARVRAQGPPIGTLEFRTGPRKGDVVPIYSGDLAGRDTDTTIVVDSTKASRWHVIFEVEGDGVSVRDLGSANGTYVNGVQASRARLKTGDEILMGDIVLRFAAPGILLADAPPPRGPNAAPPAVDTRSTAAKEPDAPTGNALVLRPGVHASTRDPGDSEIIASAPVPADLDGDSSRLEATLAYTMSNRFRPGTDRAADAERRLKLVLAILGALGATRERGELLARIVDEIFEVFPQTSRGSILLGSSAETLAPSVSRQRDDRAPDVPVSRTLAKRVLEKKEAILSRNAAQDARLDGATIALLPTHSIMAAPLVFGREALGLIYVQSGDRRRFEAEDLDLLAGLAACAAVFLKRVEVREESPPLEELEDSGSRRAEPPRAEPPRAEQARAELPRAEPPSAEPPRAPEPPSEPPPRRLELE